jgi:A/G-specific adenine glycosylase
MRSFFTQQLLKWHADHPRPLPWTGGPRDPYHIWISEVIMQQTRIEQGAPYYHRFISLFPSVESLAATSIDDVLFAWQGLGYYTRARNLHKAATYMVNHLHGKFPVSYDGLLDLPGIGHYSAAAIASFAYGLPYPVVDGNVKRLMSRFVGIREAIDTPATHELIRQHAATNMKGESPAVFNQAIMNFGALVCKPKNPDCPVCPLHQKCFAFQNNQVASLPAKSKMKSIRLRYFHFLVIHYRHSILFERRDQKDIWNGLFILPYLENHSARKPAEKYFAEKLLADVGHQHFQFNHSSQTSTQLLSHQTIHARFHHFAVTVKPKLATINQYWATKATVSTLAKPKIILDWLKEDPFSDLGNTKTNHPVRSGRRS